MTMSFSGRNRQANDEHMGNRSDVTCTVRNWHSATVGDVRYCAAPRG
jgi:hypothetical protein